MLVFCYIMAWITCGVMSTTIMASILEMNKTEYINVSLFDIYIGPLSLLFMVFVMLSVKFHWNKFQTWFFKIANRTY